MIFFAINLSNIYCLIKNSPEAHFIWLPDICAAIASLSSPQCRWFCVMTLQNVYPEIQKDEIQFWFSSTRSADSAFDIDCNNFVPSIVIKSQIIFFVSPTTHFMFLYYLFSEKAT